MAASPPSWELLYAQGDKLGEVIAQFYTKRECDRAKHRLVVSRSGEFSWCYFSTQEPVNGPDGADNISEQRERGNRRGAKKKRLGRTVSASAKPQFHKRGR